MTEFPLEFDTEALIQVGLASCKSLLAPDAIFWTADTGWVETWRAQCSLDQSSEGKLRVELYSLGIGSFVVPISFN